LRKELEMHKIIFMDGNNTEEVYIESSTYAGAIAEFRSRYPDRTRYKIEEVDKEIVGNWDEY
jgi:hypothetical protein